MERRNYSKAKQEIWCVNKESQRQHLWRQKLEKGRSSEICLQLRGTNDYNNNKKRACERPAGSVCYTLKDIVLGCRSDLRSLSAVLRVLISEVV